MSNSVINGGDEFAQHTDMASCAAWWMGKGDGREVGFGVIGTLVVGRDLRYL